MLCCSPTCKHPHLLMTPGRVAGHRSAILVSKHKRHTITADFQVQDASDVHIVNGTFTSISPGNMGLFITNKQVVAIPASTFLFGSFICEFSTGTRNESVEIGQTDFLLVIGAGSEPSQPRLTPTFPALTPTAVQEFPERSPCSQLICSF